MFFITPLRTTTFNKGVTPIFGVVKSGQNSQVHFYQYCKMSTAPTYCIRFQCKVGLNIMQAKVHIFEVPSSRTITFNKGVNYIWRKLKSSKKSQVRFYQYCTMSTAPTYCIRFQCEVGLNIKPRCILIPGNIKFIL